MEVALCRESCKRLLSPNITCVVQHDFSCFDAEITAFADEGIGTDLPACKHLDPVGRDPYVSERNWGGGTLSILFTSHCCDSRYRQRFSRLHGYVRHISRRC